ncbi:MAG: hypothetical protein WCO99_00215 [Planctomycetota bacterium]|jgi:hypothetical protein
MVEEIDMQDRRVPWHIAWKWLMVAAIMAGPVVGCGSRNDGRYQVTGSVFFDGQPLANGDITFKPADRQHGAVSCRIKDGAYALRCPPGGARVEINASRIVRVSGRNSDPDEPTTRDGTAPGDGFRDLVIEFIPKRYNEKSVLEATIEPHHRNVADFRLESE